MNSAAAVNSRHDLGNGVIVVHPTPGHGGEGIARDVLQALGKRFRDRTPRDPRRLQALAGIWLRAEVTRELVIVGADRRPAADWVVLRDLCSETVTRLTLVVERRPNRDQLAALREADVRELTVSELVYELPPSTPPDTWGIFDESGSPDERPGYPPAPDVDGAITMLRGAQASFLLNGTLLEIDPTHSPTITRATPARPRRTRLRRSCAATSSRTSPPSARSRPRPGRTPSRSPS
jgi:hypothetical protein